MPTSNFERWFKNFGGFHARDPWNIRELHDLRIDGEILGDSVEFEICILRLQALGHKAIVTWSGHPEWIATFFESGTNTTYFDDIWMQIVGSGISACNHFWIGTKFPTLEQMRVVRESYSDW